MDATALHDRAKDLLRAGRLRDGRRVLDRALAGDADPDTRAALTGTLGYVTAELGDPAGGLRLLDQALSGEDVQTRTRGTLLAQRSLLWSRLGRPKSALSDMTAALPLLPDGSADRARALLNRASMYLDQGNALAADADAREAARSFDELGQPVQAAKARHNVGYAALLRGDLVTAIHLLTQAREVLATLSEQLAAMSTQDLGEALLTAGLAAEGTELLLQARTAFRRTRLPRLQAEAEFVLARLLSTQAPREGLRLARLAAARFGRLGLDTWQLRCEAVVLACRCELGRADPERARRLAAQLRSRGLGSDALMVLLLAARASLRRGRAALIPRLPPAAAPGVRLLALAVRAERAQALGRDRQALAILRRGVEELLHWQSQHGSLDLQTSLAAHAERLTGQGLDLALGSGRRSTVYTWVERTGALASRIAPLRPPSDPEAMADLAELRTLAQSAPHPGTPEALRQRELFERVRRRAWQDEGSARVNRLVHVGRVQEELGRTDACLIAPMAGRGRAWVLVVSRRHCALVDLGPVERVRAELAGLPADLDLAAADLSAAMTAVVRGSLRERLARLDALVLAPVARQLTARRVVVNPTGIFSGLPWTLMPTLSGRAVTIPRSASAWVTGRERPHEYALAGFAAGPRLTRAEPEVVRAASFWPRAEVLREAESTAGAVSAMAGRVDVLHLAAHGRHEPDNPLFSHLDLVDGPWYGYDLDQLADIPEVVILSACELGATTIRRGDELLGLTTAWLHAGARCVIASPASVSDAVAEAILPDVHRLLAAGVMPGDALAQATAGHPELTSTFQCYGAGW